MNKSITKTRIPMRKIIWLISGILVLLCTLYSYNTTNHDPESEVILAIFTAVYILPIGVFIEQIFGTIVKLFPSAKEISYQQITIQWLIVMILSYIQWFIVLPLLWQKIYLVIKHNFSQNIDN